jgi:hypothetical protein
MLRYMEGYKEISIFLRFYMLIASYQRIQFAHIVAFEGEAHHEGSFILFLITLAQNIFIKVLNLAERFRFLLPAAMPFEHHTQTSFICIAVKTCFMCKDGHGCTRMSNLGRKYFQHSVWVVVLSTHWKPVKRKKKAYAFECQSCHYMAYFEPEPNNLVTGLTLLGGRWMRKDVR